MPKLTESTQEERRRRILEAAARCFQRKGFQATTIPEICAEAGVSTGAIYTWFDSKADIVVALAERSQAERQELLSRWTTRVELTAGLGEVAAALLDSTAAPLDVHLWSGALTDETLRELTLGSFDTVLTSLADTLRSPLTDDNARGLAGVLVATVVGIEVLSALGSPDAEATVEEYQRLLAQIGGSHG